MEQIHLYSRGTKRKGKSLAFSVETGASVAGGGSTAALPSRGIIIPAADSCSATLLCGCRHARRAGAAFLSSQRGLQLIISVVSRGPCSITAWFGLSPEAPATWSCCGSASTGWEGSHIEICLRRGPGRVHFLQEMNWDVFIMQRVIPQTASACGRQQTIPLPAGRAFPEGKQPLS